MLFARSALRYRDLQAVPRFRSAHAACPSPTLLARPTSSSRLSLRYIRPTFYFASGRLEMRRNGVMELAGRGAWSYGSRGGSVDQRRAVCFCPPTPRAPRSPACRCSSYPQLFANPSMQELPRRAPSSA
ncbi:hypothetical protein BJY59DRAFT_706068 [Rhodotorula toruloides]